MLGSSAIGPRPVTSAPRREALGLDPTSLRILVDALGEGVLLLDGDGAVAVCSDGAARLLERAADVVEGRRIEPLLEQALHMRDSQLARLRAGDAVALDAPDGRVGALRACWIKLAAAGAEGSALAPTAIVLRDLRPERERRRLEELVTRLREDAAVIDPYARRDERLVRASEIQRDLARECRRARRDGEPLSIVVVQGPAGQEPDALALQVARGLRGDDRAGPLVPSRFTSADDEVTLTELPGPAAEPGAPLCLVVLPGTPGTGADAVMLRLRNMFLASGERGVRVAGASFGAPGPLSPKELLAQATRELERAAEAAGDGRVDEDTQVARVPRAS
jgi:PAS domain-containing protein